MKAKQITNEFSTLSNERRGTGQKGGRGATGPGRGFSTLEKLFETLTRAPILRFYAPISFGEFSESCENA